MEADPKLVQDEERALVERVLAKDSQAEEAFVLAYRPRLYRVAVAVLGYQDPEAEDVVQETFVDALASLQRFEFRSSLYTWLNQICVHRCFRRIRSRKKVILGLELDMAHALGSRPGSDEAALEALKERRLDWLKESILSLGKACRELLQGRDLEGRTYAALSATFKVPIGTIMSRLSRCRARLKQMAAEWKGATDV